MGVPKYQIIRNELEAEILSGDFKPGDRFYSERDLIERFNVSSITVIRAIRDLADMGYVVRRQGLGTFITRARKRQRVEFSDIEVFSSHAQDETVEVIRFERGTDPEVAKIMKLRAGESYWTIERVRAVEGEPFLVSESHIPERFIDPDADPTRYQSIYGFIREAFGIALYDEASYEVDTIEMPIPERIARLMACDMNTPCVRQEKTTTLDDGTVIEHVIGYKRWDFYKIELRSSPV
ncbi:GntR family transcriptional regulator [Collinsella sp. AGMB00827]|uniref:GntR family transcriptional regulator n=1 Tax=Collinsella ureilytica TaxID=2869515 RepID=A0ABS7MJ77_9ACTN|nr:GntR family transcriptional regulator [Collinsella urealyticum]MBY4797429.1 GntR family transcriptional regulator [Collinsella urealyticum]